MQMGTNQPKIGTYNNSVVLSAIQSSDGISRVEIAERSGLTAQTVSVIVRRLVADGLVREEGTIPSAIGKPRTALRVVAEAGYSIGIHFDPIEVSCVLVDLAGRPVARSSKRITANLDPESLVASTARVAQQLVKRSRIDSSAVLGLGAACPGPIDQTQGLVISPPRRDRWTEVPLKKLLEEQTGLPVIIDNDATAAAIGERWAGIGRSVPNFAYLYLGTGIGGGVFLANQVYRGASLNAAEFGHIVVEPNGPVCYCGNRGCLEAMCKPASLVESVRSQLEAGQSSSLCDAYARDPATLTAAAIGSAAAAGDPVAREVVDRAADYLADAAVVIANVLDVELLVVGGHSLRDVGEIYRERIAGALTRLPLARKVHTVGVALSRLAEDAAAIGAASLVFHQAYAPSIADLTTDVARQAE